MILNSLSLFLSLSLAFEARTFNRATLLCGRTNTALVFSRLLEKTTERYSTDDDFRACSLCALLVFFERLLFRVFDGKNSKNFSKNRRRLTSSSSEEVFGHARIHHPQDSRRR